METPTTLPELPHHQVRYYQTEKKTLSECYNHGADHGAYNWTRQLDPRWNAEQRKAYLDGYDSQLWL